MSSGVYGTNISYLRAGASCLPGIGHALYLCTPHEKISKEVTASNLFSLKETIVHQTCLLTANLLTLIGVISLVAFGIFTGPAGWLSIAFMVGFTLFNGQRLYRTLSAFDEVADESLRFLSGRPSKAEENDAIRSALEKTCSKTFLDKHFPAKK